MSATIIDALLVTLGLDVSGFKKGQAQADEALKKTKDNTVKHAKDIEAKAKAATESFAGMRKELLRLVGMFVTVNGIKGFVERITASDAAVGRLAENLNIATDELSAWRNLSTKFGGSGEDVDGFFRNINKIAQEIKLFGSSGALQPLGRLLGPEGLARFADNATTIAEKARIIQSAVAGASSRQDALSLMQQAGFTEQTVTVMREIGNDLERQLQLQRELNVASKRDADLAKERSAAWDRFTDALEKAGRAMLNSPIFNFVDKLNAAAEKIAKWTDNPGKILPDLAGSIFKPEVNDWIKRNIGSKLPSMEGGFTTKNLVGRAIDGAWDWFLDFGTPDYKKKPKAQPPKQTSDAGGSLQYGSAAFNSQFYGDLIRGAEFGGDALSRLTGSQAAAGLASRAGAARPGGTTQKVDISIGSMHVNTQATDARGIARDIGGALRANYSLATQANFGAN